MEGQLEAAACAARLQEKQSHLGQSITGLK
jgi:hypothetical protein